MDIFDRNIFKRTFSTIDDDVLAQIKYFEQQALDLRRSAGMITYTYIPQVHDVFTKNLIKKGNRIIIIEKDLRPDKNSGLRCYGTVYDFYPIDSTALESEVDPMILKHNGYYEYKQPYLKIEIVVEKFQTIPMLKGRSDYVYLAEIWGDAKL